MTKEKENMQKTKKVNGLDAFLVGFGSIVQICPMTDAAMDWLKANTQAEGWNWMGRNLCVEARYANDIVQGMRGDGLKV